MLMELELRSKRNISSMFNMVGGSSFGAIIAACLTYPTLLNKKKPKFMSRDIMSHTTFPQQHNLITLS